MLIVISGICSKHPGKSISPIGGKKILTDPRHVKRKPQILLTLSLKDGVKWEKYIGMGVSGRRDE